MMLKIKFTMKIEFYEEKDTNSVLKIDFKNEKQRNFENSNSTLNDSF